MRHFLFKKWPKATGLNVVQRAVFMCVIDGDQTGEGCFQSNGYIMDWTGIECAKTVSRNIAKLIALGYVRREDRKGRTRNTRHLFVTNAGWALLEECSGSEGEAATDAPVTPLPTQAADVAPEPTPKPKKEKSERKRNPTADEHCERELPDFIPREVWSEFIRVRHAEFGPFSELSATQLVNKIEGLRKEGHDPAKLLRRATLNCWKSVFPDDKGKETRASTDPRDNFPGDGGRMRFNGRLVQ